MRQRVTVDRFYPHPPERVWRALTDPTALQSWLMPTNFRPRLGRKFRFRGPSGKDAPGKVRGRVVTLEEPHRLAYTWQSERDVAPTLVTWTLEPVEGGTRVRLEHTGIEAPTATARNINGMPHWESILNISLPVALEHRTQRPMGRLILPDSAIVRCVGTTRRRVQRKERVLC